MPKFAKLAKEDVESLRGRRGEFRAIDLSAYFSFLDSLKAGEWGAIELEQGESSRAIKRRLTIAAKQKQRKIKYRRAPEPGKIVIEAL